MKRHWLLGLAGVLAATAILASDPKELVRCQDGKLPLMTTRIKCFHRSGSTPTGGLDRSDWFLAQEEEAAEEAMKAEAAEKNRVAAKRSAETWVKSHPERDPKWLRSRAGQVWRRHPGWSDQVCQMVAARRADIGMTKEMVREAWGRPEQINETYAGGHQSEQWVYGIGNYVYFDSGVMTSMQRSHR